MKISDYQNQLKSWLAGDKGFAGVAILLEDSLSTGVRAAEAISQGGGLCIVIRRPALTCSGYTVDRSPVWEAASSEIEIWEGSAYRAGEDAPGSYELARAAPRVFAQAQNEISIIGIREEKDEAAGIASVILTISYTFFFTA